MPVSPHQPVLIRSVWRLLHQSVPATSVASQRLHVDLPHTFFKDFSAPSRLAPVRCLNHPATRNYQMDREYFSAPKYLISAQICRVIYVSNPCKYLERC
jgi:hypothetical protein